MAGNVGNLFVSLGLKDAQYVRNLKKNVNASKKASEDIKKHFKRAALGISAAFVAATYTLKKFVDASAEQERIFRSLRTAVELQGISWKEAKVEIDKFAKTLQATTVYGDTDTAAILQKLFIYTNNLQKAMRGAKIAMNMASSGLFDVNTAARYVGMAMTGNIEILGRYIAEFKAANNEQLKNMDAAQKAAYAMEVLGRKFEGTAENELETAIGRLKQLWNYLGDIKEAMGDKLLGRLKEIVKGWVEWIRQNQELIQQKVDKYMGEVAKGLEHIYENRNAFKDILDHTTQLAVNLITITEWLGVAWKLMKAGAAMHRQTHYGMVPLQPFPLEPPEYGMEPPPFVPFEFGKEEEAVKKQTEEYKKLNKERNKYRLIGLTAGGFKPSPLITKTEFDPYMKAKTQMGVLAAKTKVEMLETYSTIADFARDKIQSISAGWYNLSSNISDVLANSVMESGNAFRNIANAFRRMLEIMAAQLAAKAAVFAVLSAFGVPGFVAPNFKKFMFPGFQSGGMVYKPTLAMVGESGPERILNPQETREYNQNDYSDRSVWHIHFDSGSRGAAMLTDMQLAERIKKLKREGYEI